MELPPLLIYSASWVTLSGGLWALFERAEKSMSDQGKQATTNWLKSISTTDNSSSWSESFASAFDSIFGNKHFSRSCFIRSSIASYISLTIVFFIWAFLRQDEFQLITSFDEVLSTVIILFGLALFLNVFPDFISLYQTRLFLKIINNKPNIMFTVAVLICDVVITGIVATTPYIIALSFSGYIDQLPNIVTSAVMLSTKTEVTVTEGILPFGAWFYSTFFTSVWL